MLTQIMIRPIASTTMLFCLSCSDPSSKRAGGAVATEALTKNGKEAPTGKRFFDDQLDFDQDDGWPPPRGPSDAMSAAALPGGRMKVVKDNKIDLQRCYDSTKRSDAFVKLVVEVILTASGTVKSVQIKGEDVGSTHRCLRRIVKRWRFPESPQDSPFAFPLVYSGGELMN